MPSDTRTPWPPPDAPSEAPSGWKAAIRDADPSYVRHDGRPTERTAIWSLLCSLVGVVFGLAAVAGIMLGFRARGNIIRAEGRVKGEGLALAGIILGCGGVALTLTIVLVDVFAGHPMSDAALAQSELVHPSQYPSGFVGQGPGTNATQMSYFSDWGPYTVSCLGMSISYVDPSPAEAGGQEWDRGNVWINDTVDVFPTIVAAHTDETAAAKSNALQCAFRSTPWRTLDQWIGPGLGKGEHDDPPVPIAVSVIGHDVALESWSLRYTYEGRAGIYYDDWITVQIGRSESNIWISNLGAPVPPKLVEQMVAAARIRMRSR